MLQHRLLRRLVTVLALFALLPQGTGVLAGTTGQLAGTLIDVSSQKPIPNARVTAASPSQTVTVTTDASGTFTFVSLAPDTYTVSSSTSGYEQATVAGVTVQADQTQRISLTTSRALQVIGKTTVRAASELVRPGTTADVYSVNSVTQDKASILGGGGSLNQAYSAIASVPGTYVPQGQSGWAQSVYVRGGNYTQLGYEYDGIPVQRAFDAYPGNTVSALGQQELQVYTGAAPANAASTGLSGFINQVIRTGTAPATTTIEAATGGPAFYRKGQVETGGANPARTFSYYAAGAAYDQQYRLASQFNGDEFSSLYGSPYGILTTNCGTAHPSAGCYANTALLGFGFAPLGPNGYAFGPFDLAAVSVNQNREAVANIHFGLPKKNGTKDDIQLLYEMSYLRTHYATGLNYWGPVTGDIINGTITQNGVTYPSCTTKITNNCANMQASAPAWFDTNMYTGPVGGVLTRANLTQVSPYLYPFSPTGRVLGGDINPNSTDTYNIRTGIGKLQYQRNLNERSFLRLYGYTFYSDWFNIGPNGFGYNLVSTLPPDYELVTHTRGVSLSYVNQITDKHLLDLTGSYTYANTVRWNNSFFSQQPVAVLVDSTHPTNGLCYSRTTPRVAVYCGSTNAGQYRVSADPTTPGLVPYRGSPSLATVGSLTCGAGPCEYDIVGSGTGNGSFNTVQPRFTSVSLSDDWHPTSRWTVNAGVKYDIFRYDLPPTDSPSGPIPQPVPAIARQLFVNSFNLFNCFNPVTSLVVNATSPGVCPAGTTPIHYTTSSTASNQYITWSPRVGMTYQMGANDVLRASWGKYIQPANSSFQQYNAATTNLLAATANRALLSLGIDSPQRIVDPQYSYNTDASWEHAFRNTDVSLKFSPFYRTTQGEILNVLLDPKTNFVSGINVGNKKVWGAELQLRKGDFSRNGFSGLLSYTYTDGRIHFNRLPNGLTVVDGLNGSIGQYNAYTSACAAATPKGTPNSPCFDRFGNKQLTSAGTTAAACFTAKGAPDPTCTAGSIANPYWNAPPQSKFDPGADYVVYNQLPGSTLNAVASSYIVPHVATFILNYKHNKLSITPSLQFASGGRYGSPVVGFGIDPAAGCSALAGAIAGDPRYPYGAAGGAPYDASTCAAGVVTPNQYTRQFDTFGAFREPSLLVGNLQLSYDVSKNVTFRLTAANLLNRCFGGSNEPWNLSFPLNCWYTTGYLGNIGNFYNPGDVIQPSVAFPYGPSIAQVFQQTYGGQANPFNIYFSVSVRLH